MIFDRTQSDIDAALSVREKLQSGYDLTDEEIEVLEKGTFTINTISRILNKQQELKTLLNEMGYYGIKINIPSGDIFDIDDFKSLVENADSLRKSFFAFANTPNSPQLKYHFSNINDLEKILFDVGEMVSLVKSKYRQCGTFACGEEA